MGFRAAEGKLYLFKINIYLTSYIRLSVFVHFPVKTYMRSYVIKLITHLVYSLFFLHYCHP